LKLPTEQVPLTQTRPAAQSLLARHDSPRALSFDDSVELLSELQAAKSAPIMKSAAPARLAKDLILSTPLSRSPHEARE
jgi:hypothetical protein